MTPIISVQLDEVSALAAELAGLAAQLDDRTRLCRSAAALSTDALGGSEGSTAAAVATTWSSLVGLVVERTDAAAGALASAVAAYRAADAAIADRWCPADPGFTPPAA